MPPKKNKVSSSPCKPGPDVVHKPDPTKQAFKRNMEELGPVLEATMEDLDEYYNIVRKMELDPAKYKNEMMLQKSVVVKMEQALDALQEAAALTHFADGGRKKKKTED